MMATPLGVFELVVLVTIGLCILAIFTSIIINFTEAKRTKTKYESRSIVDTGTMTLFFLFFYALIRFKIGEIKMDNLPLRIILIIIGLSVIILGTVVNISGRLKLGKNWANQIKIYEDQSLVTDGAYGLVRHPLYASLIWMFYGATLIYLNYAAFLANTLVFVPFMYYRAKQEEALLMKQFKNYGAYKKNVGMFFPKSGGKKW